MRTAASHLVRVELAEPPVVTNAAGPPIRHDPSVRGAFACAMIAAGLLLRSAWAFSAELGADGSGAIGSPEPHASPTRRDQVRVQPRAWEFTPPYGRHDLTSEHARVVDELYAELMRATPQARKEITGEARPLRALVG